MFGNRLIKSNNAGAACTTDTVQILDGTPLESIATYQLNGAATSIPNNTYPGTANNITYAAGKFGNAGEFNGSSSYIQSISLGTQFRGQTTLSISCWFRTTTNSSLLSLVTFSTTGDASTELSLNVRSDQTGDSVGFFNRNNGTAIVSCEVSGGASVIDGDWHHVVFTADTNGTKLYLDGSELTNRTFGAGSASTQIVMPNDLNSFNIGANIDSGGAQYFYNGSIDQIRIFNTALSAGAVTNLYNETVATASNSYINIPSCIAYYKMSDATDETGSYDGTPTNVNFNVAGKFGNAGEFNGSSSGIDTNNNNNYTTFTFSSWIKFDSTAANYQTIYSQDSAHASLAAFYIGYNFDVGKRFASVITQSDGTVLRADSGVTPVVGTWYNIVVSVTPTNTKIYINGVFKNEITFASRNAGTGNSVIGGGYFNNAVVDRVNGKIDQVRIFNRAITANEVTTLYNEVECIPTIVPSEHFNPVLYTGNGGTQSITSLDFQPDFTWIKSRDFSNRNHRLFDSVRGATKVLSSDITNAEVTELSLTSFNTNGFTLGSAGNQNNTSEDYVAWNWKAGGDDVQNTDGTITSQVSANVDAGFSIVSYTGNGSTSTVGHGLSLIVELLIVKGRETTNDWAVLHKDGADGEFLQLNSSAAQSGSGGIFGNPTARPTDSVFTIGNAGETGTINKDYIAYCFHSVDGFSKIGSYVGTNAPNNNIVTGFEPAMIMIKSTGATNGDWNIFDNKRNTTNPLTDVLKANTSGAETTEAALNINFLENGFSLNGAASSGGTGQINKNGTTYIFMAFAADPAPEPVLANSFNTVTYTGNGGTQSVTGVGFQPDLVWTKGRTVAYDPGIQDSVRGVNIAFFILH